MVCCFLKQCVFSVGSAALEFCLVLNVNSRQCLENQVHSFTHIAHRRLSMSNAFSLIGFVVFTVCLVSAKHRLCI